MLLQQCCRNLTTLRPVESCTVQGSCALVGQTGSAACPICADLYVCTQASMILFLSVCPLLPTHTGAFMEKQLTMRGGQTPVQRYWWVPGRCPSYLHALSCCPLHSMLATIHTSLCLSVRLPACPSTAAVQAHSGAQGGQRGAEALNGGDPRAAP